MQFKPFCKPPGNSGSLLTSTMLRIMNLTAIFLFISCLQVSANGHAQNVTLSEKNVPLEKVFREIKKQTGYVFFFDEAWIKKANKVTIEVKDVSILSALDICFKDQQLTYTIITNTIVIEPKPVLTNPNLPVERISTLPPPVEIHGKVVNQKGEPIQNVSILIAGTKIGTTSDNGGRFMITAGRFKHLTQLLFIKKHKLQHDKEVQPNQFSRAY